MIPGQTVRPTPAERVTCIRSASEGGPFIFDFELGPGGKGPPVHSHDEGDEIIDVLEGEIVFKVNGEERLLRKGDRVVLTPQDPHTFWNPSKTTPVLCRVEHGARFERAIAQSSFPALAMYLTYEDPGASRAANPFVRAVLGVIAFFSRLAGVKVVTA